MDDFLDLSPIEQELEALAAIYLDDLEIRRRDDGQIDEIELVLHPATGDDTAKKFVRMNLVFQPGCKYPDEIPEIVIRNPRGIAEEEVISLVKDMKEKAMENFGEMMLYTLIEMAKDSLTEGNIPHCPCVVCLEHFQEDDLFHRTACYHYFHTRCLHHYVDHSQRQIELARIEAEQNKQLTPGEKKEETAIICPVCRSPLDSESLAVTCCEPEEEGDDDFEMPAELREQQRWMAELYEKQKAKGAIIDLEWEKNKFLVNPDERLPIQASVKSGSNKESEETSAKNVEEKAEFNKASDKTRSSKDGRHYRGGFADRHSKHQDRRKDERHHQDSYARNGGHWRDRGRGRGGGFRDGRDRREEHRRDNIGSARQAEDKKSESNNSGRKGNEAERDGGGGRTREEVVVGSNVLSSRSRREGEEVVGGSVSRSRREGEEGRERVLPDNDSREAGSRRFSNERTTKNPAATRDEVMSNVDRREDVRFAGRRGRGGGERGRDHHNQTNNRLLREGERDSNRGENRRLGASHGQVQREEDFRGELSSSRRSGKEVVEENEDDDKQHAKDRRSHRYDEEPRPSSQNGQEIGGGRGRGVDQREVRVRGEASRRGRGRGNSGYDNDRNRGGASRPSGAARYPDTTGRLDHGTDGRRENGFDHDNENKKQSGGDDQQQQHQRNDHSRGQHHQGRRGTGGDNRGRRTEFSRGGGERRGRGYYQESGGSRSDQRGSGPVVRGDDDDDEEEGVARKADLRNAEINRRWREVNFGSPQVGESGPTGRGFRVIDDDEADVRRSPWRARRDGDDEMVNGKGNDDNDEQCYGINPHYAATNARQYYSVAASSDEDWEKESDPYTFERKRIRPDRFQEYGKYRAAEEARIDARINTRVEKHNSVREEERRIRREQAAAAGGKRKEEDDGMIPAPTLSILEQFKLKEKEKERQAEEAKKTSEEEEKKKRNVNFDNSNRRESSSSSSDNRGEGSDDSDGTEDLASSSYLGKSGYGNSNNDKANGGSVQEAGSRFVEKSTALSTKNKTEGIKWVGVRSHEEEEDAGDGACSLTNGMGEHDNEAYEEVWKRREQKRRERPKTNNKKEKENSFNQKPKNITSSSTHDGDDVDDGMKDGEGERERRRANRRSSNRNTVVGEESGAVQVPGSVKKSSNRACLSKEKSSNSKSFSSRPAANGFTPLNPSHSDTHKENYPGNCTSFKSEEDDERNESESQTSVNGGTKSLPSSTSNNFKSRRSKPLDFRKKSKSCNGGAVVASSHSHSTTPDNDNDVKVVREFTEDYDLASSLLLRETSSNARQPGRHEEFQPQSQGRIGISSVDAATDLDNRTNTNTTGECLTSCSTTAKLSKSVEGKLKLKESSVSSSSSPASSLKKPKPLDFRKGQPPKKL